MFSGTSDPLPPAHCSAASDGSVQRSCAEVMMVGTTSNHHSSRGTAARAARETAAVATTRPSEKRDVLSTPVERSADLAAAHAELEKARQQLAECAKSIDAEKHRLEATVREYNAAHAAAPRMIEPAVLEGLRISGRAVGHELAGTERPAASGLGPQPAYSSQIGT